MDIEKMIGVLFSGFGKVTAFALFALAGVVKFLKIPVLGKVLSTIIGCTAIVLAVAGVCITFIDLSFGATLAFWSLVALRLAITTLEPEAVDHLMEVGVKYFCYKKENWC